MSAETPPPPEPERASPPLQRVGTGALASHFVWSLVRQLPTLVSGILLAHWLGPEGRGLLAAALLWPVPFAQIGLVGLNLHLQNQARRDPAQIPSLVARAMPTAILIGVFQAVLLWFAIPLLVPEDADSIITASRIFAMTLPLCHVGTVAWSFYLALGWMGLQGRIFAAGSFLYVGAIVVLALAGHLTPSTAVFATMFSLPVPLFVHAVAYARHFGIGRGPAWDGQLVRSGLPFFAEQIAQVAVEQGGRVVLLWIATTSDLGLFAAAWAFVMLSANLGKSINQILFLRFSESTSLAEQRPLVAAAFRQTFLVQAPALGGLAAVAPLVVPLLFGAEFTPAALPAAILLMAALVQGQTRVLYTAMRSEGEPVLAAWLQVVAFVAIIVLSFPFVRASGVLGLSVAFLLGYIVELFVVSETFARRYQFTRASLFIPRGEDFTLILSRLGGMAGRFLRRGK